MQIRRAETEEDVARVKSLWTAYWETLGFPLTFQGFGEQLRRLPGEFAAPAGLLLLAIRDDNAMGTIGVRPLREHACEAKRLYVPAQYRGEGLGRRLLTSAIEQARAAGYQAMYADTLTSMHEAARLYAAFGFEQIDAYSEDPTPGAIYLRLAL
jgi:putative acetyltransferase